MHWGSDLSPDLGSNVSPDSFWLSYGLDLPGNQTFLCQKYKPRWRTRAVPNKFVNTTLRTYYILDGQEPNPPMLS